MDEKTRAFCEALTQLMLATVNRMHEIAEEFDKDFVEVAEAAIYAIVAVNEVEERTDWENGIIRGRKKDE